MLEVDAAEHVGPAGVAFHFIREGGIPDDEMQRMNRPLPG
jgi:hypothetical protein